MDHLPSTGYTPAGRRVLPCRPERKLTLSDNTPRAAAVAAASSSPPTAVYLHVPAGNEYVYSCYYLLVRAISIN